MPSDIPSEYQACGDYETRMAERDIRNKITFVRKLTISDTVSLGLYTIIYGWLSGVFFSLSLIVFFPSILSQSYALSIIYLLWLIIPGILLALLLTRNFLYERYFNFKNAKIYLEINNAWRFLFPVLVILLVTYYLIYGVIGLNDSRYYMLSLAILMFMIPLFEIYNKPLTENGEVYLLIDRLLPSIVNFHEAQIYWKRIARKVEQKLRAGNIEISRKDLIFDFSKKLMISDGELTAELLSVRNWLLGISASCYDGLWGLNPKIELVRCRENPFISWLIKNPEKTIRYVFFVALTVISIVLAVIGLDTNLISEIIKLI